MQWLEAKVVFSSDDQELAFELIGSIFFDMGLKGVVLGDPALQPDEGWGRDAVPLPAQPSVAGFFPDNERLPHRCRKLERALAQLAHDTDLRYQILYRRLDEEDWAHSWKAFFHPQKISSRIVVKPTWEPYTAEPHEIVLEIDPGMAFGTGTHPTTALCVALIEKYLRSGQTMLDVGTGSGILMLAAAKLGAAFVEGVDVDEVAVRIAHENLDRNRIDASGYALHIGNLTSAVNRQFDLVTANILSDVISTLLENIAPVLKPNGIFICSGIIAAKKDMILDKMAAIGMHVLEVACQDEWVAIAGQR